MKTQNEAIDMQVFDLLEGNLDGEQAAEVQRMIAEDPAWAQSYRLMKMTYLQEKDDDYAMDMAVKDVLYRKTYFISNLRRYYPGVAAAFALLALGVWFYNANFRHIPGQRISNTQKTDNEPQLNQTFKENPHISDTESQAALYPAVPMPGKKWPSGGSSAKKIEYASIAVEPEIQLNEDYLLPGLPNRNMLHPVSNSNLRPALAEVHQFRYPDQRYVPLQQKRSLYYRAMNQGKEMLAWVSNPSLKLVRTEKEGRDGLMLRLQTQRMEIIATLID